MNWKNVKLVFLREVRDQLRDRRTLFMVAVYRFGSHVPVPGIDLGSIRDLEARADDDATIICISRS